MNGRLLILTLNFSKIFNNIIGDNTINAEKIKK